MNDDILQQRINRAGDTTVALLLSDEEQAFADAHGWTDENIETIIYLWRGYADPMTGKPLELIEFMRRTGHAQHATTTVESTPDSDIVQVVMHGSVLKAVASFLGGKNLLVSPWPTEGDDLPTFMVSPR